MSAEVLREAAALMRSRVKAVREAAEEPDMWFGADEIAASFDFSGVGDMGDARADAEHIASWHPAVALAVADWLDAEFAHAFGPTGEAIEVARLYMGADQ